jgi:hypothetical protein
MAIMAKAVLSGAPQNVRRWMENVRKHNTRQECSAMKTVIPETSRYAATQ